MRFGTAVWTAFLGIIEGGYRTGGYRKNAFVDPRQAQRWVRGTCSGFLIYSIVEKRHLDMYQNRCDASRIRINARWVGVVFGSGSQGYPPPRHPPYDYSSFYSHLGGNFLGSGVWSTEVDMGEHMPL